MKIATWNINSVRHRIGLVTRFLRDQQPDVLCLQETKVINELFPAEPLAKLGYVHQAIHGQKAYHGVAMLSRLPFAKDRGAGFLPRRPCPAYGRDVREWRGAAQFLCARRAAIFPIPSSNEKFAHKLHFLGAMEKFFAARKAKRKRSGDAGGRSECRAAGK